MGTACGAVLNGKGKTRIFLLMDEQLFYPQDSIAALATPWGESALAVVRVSGTGSLALLSTVFKPAGGRKRGRGLADVPGHTIHHGSIEDSSNSGAGETIDEVLVAVYRGPKSFTGEDGAEIFSHGSPVIIRRLLGLLQKAGFRLAGPGEFTLRAFLNRKLDLTQAEAVNEVVRAKTDRARAIALSRLSGAIEGSINRIKRGIRELSADVEVTLDYPEEELDEDIPAAAEEAAARWQEELERLLATYRLGKIYQEGITVVLAGRTNSGKSTLFNRMLKEDRAIVSEVHGTTRDYLEGLVDLEGIPVKLYDTAGYREGGDSIEQEGMRRTDNIVKNAHIVLYLVDAQDGLSAGDREFLQINAADRRLIAVWNKIDLKGGVCPEGFVPVSAASGEGLEALVREITARVLDGPGAGGREEPIIDSLRQKQLLERALEGLSGFRRGQREGQPLDVLAVDLKEILDALGEITGEVTSQDILDSIFSRFCVGK